MKTPLAVAIVWCCGCSIAFAQAFNNVGSTGAQFLKIGVGARAMGMGGAYASIAGDPVDLAWNPAGIGTIEGIQVSAQHTVWVAGMSHDFVGLVVPVTDQFSLGFHTVFLSSGDIEITTIDNPGGTGQFYNVADIATGLTGSVRLTNQLTFALTVKYVEERIYDLKSGGPALDAGVWYSTDFRSLNLGFAVAQVGFDQTFSGRSLDVKYTPPAPGEPPLKSELGVQPYSLPLLFRASGSFDVFQMFFDEHVDDPLLLAIDFVQNTDTPERVTLGAEYGWQRTVFLRSGYVFNADELSWNVGGGLHLDVKNVRFTADYAASWLGRFGIGHRFGLTVAYF
jgi:hypothetical protein